MLKKSLLLLALLPLIACAQTEVAPDETSFHISLELRQGGRVVPAFEWDVPSGMTSRFEKDLVTCTDLLARDSIRSSYVANCDAVGFSGAITAADYDSTGLIKTLLKLRLNGLKFSDYLAPEARAPFHVLKLKPNEPFVIAQGEHGFELLVRATAKLPAAQPIRPSQVIPVDPPSPFE